MRRRHVMGATAAAGVAAYPLVVRPRQLRWAGPTTSPTGRFRATKLLARADLSATRAITVDAEAAEVWPWIVQLGQGRGGFYSYDFLENLVGCDIHSADRIVPKWQQVAVGDEVRLAPEVGLSVASVEPGRSLVLQGAVPVGKSTPPYDDFTWAFTLGDEQPETTRLLVRERYAYTRPWARLIIEPTAVLSFVMSQRMLRGIKARAER